MKKLVLVSDSHGRIENLQKLAPIFEENDYVVHLGDGAADMRSFSKENPDKYYVMQGNCDYALALQEYVLEVEGVRIFMTHGHRYSVKTELLSLAMAAKARNCTVALYGHTHIANILEVDGVLCINPGSIKYPLEAGGSYCYLVIHGEKVCPTIVGKPLFG
ncbi:MAG: metallophosphoesterase [Clostridia bacterium]|nr:metallophosphoesterase [Clostridia bacterium]